MQSEPYGCLGKCFTYLFSWYLKIEEWLGFITIRNEDRAPTLGELPLIIIANHPSLKEAITIPFLRIFFQQWKHDVSLVPFSTPDKLNMRTIFWWFTWLYQSRMIGIEREGRTSNRNAIRAMHSVLRGSGTIVLFPEGTRSHKAIAARGEIRYNNRRMGEPNPAVAELFRFLRSRHEELHLMPIYVERCRLWGPFYKTTFHIGKTVSAKELQPLQIAPFILQA